MKTPFNKPYLTGKEAHYLYQAVYSGHISGNGVYTKKCQAFFEERFGFKKTLLTTSCTDALEMCALLIDIQPGDEVIVPSYTFVSTALAFVRQGAKLIFADSRKDHPGMDESSLESLITPKTKAIVPVHYAGVACDMEIVMEVAKKHNIFVIEDAAQAIDSYYTVTKLHSSLGDQGAKLALGSIGHLATFSFHETKNIQCGEGGLLAINNDRFEKRAEVLWEKGTNRAEFFRGEVNKYGWVDTGSSFLPNELTASFLYAQLEEMDSIQQRRKEIWNGYYEGLKDWANENKVHLPLVPDYATNNGHMFYLICPNADFRTMLIKHLKNENIHAVFHYLSLHKSEYIEKLQYMTQDCPLSDEYTDQLLRLPLYYELKSLSSIISIITNYKHL
ncbi:dTDP-4-amino-4,6-dideoxygalactose transaminase [Flammeovirga pacifica]|uniref:dTDP-4-amino-4,6-dideoxygalactose transaminase n=1 Tax=Flammeovirga pacifica TaxID=915059 RepID=A0A1S1YVR5_FLAPC|nr:dTDP-4-amino-4,6-dideoxygalactose transaminase [Flammeovirga pacifica]OHX64943.1 dTDP-4-amino-4,6-dideoxygalactose transaminase [Flammeovirga pacifica]